jgi:hypothetical protein
MDIQSDAEIARRCGCADVPVPEPSTAWALLSGLVLFVLKRRLADSSTHTAPESPTSESS